MTNSVPLFSLARTTMESGEKVGSLVGVGDDDPGGADELGVRSPVALGDAPVVGRPPVPVPDDEADGSEPGGPDAHAVTTQTEPMATTPTQQ